MSTSALSGLAHRAPQVQIRTDAADLEHYGRDWTRRWTPAPLAIAFPSSVKDVQEIVRWAVEFGVALVPSGGRTGLSGGAVAANGELVVSFDRMNRVLGFDPVDRYLTVQPGVALQTVQEAARERGLLYPVDFGSRGSCQIGGNIATNAGGIRVIRYGSTRQWVSGLKLVSGDGSLLDLNRGLIKNASGYDLRHLVIGSEGTLGLVVEATLALTDAPPPSQVMLLALPAMDALMRVFELCRARLTLSAFEFFTDRALNHVVAHGAKPPFDDAWPYYVVTEFDSADEPAQAVALEVFEHCMEAGWVTDGVLSQSDAQAATMWKLREGITESLASYRPYKNDISMRISVVPAFLGEMHGLFEREYPGFDVVWFGHIGDGNLHINIVKAAEMADDTFIRQCEQVTHVLAAKLAALGGSISAEHGIGLVKKAELGSVRSAAEIRIMQGIRAVLDPAGIMNPGKLFDAGRR